MTPELRGEILAQNFIAQCDYWPRMERIVRKLDELLTAADALKAAPPQAAESLQAGVQ